LRLPQIGEAIQETSSPPESVSLEETLPSVPLTFNWAISPTLFGVFIVIVTFAGLQLGGVGVGEFVYVGVSVGVKVLVGVGELVFVGVGVGVFVLVGIGVAV
jgi:hypothetical protein